LVENGFRIFLKVLLGCIEVQKLITTTLCFVQSFLVVHSRFLYSATASLGHGAVNLQPQHFLSSIVLCFTAIYINLILFNICYNFNKVPRFELLFWTYSEFLLFSQHVLNDEIKNIICNSLFVFFFRKIQCFGLFSKQPVLHLYLIQVLVNFIWFLPLNSMFLTFMIGNKFDLRRASRISVDVILQSRPYRGRCQCGFLSGAPNQALPISQCQNTA
jgi:hypothetical protein